MLNLIKLLTKDYHGKTFFLCLSSDEVTMDQMIPKATLKFEEDEEGGTLTLTGLLEVATITVDDEVAIVPDTNISDDEKEEGTLSGFTIEYPSGTELQVVIYENEE